LALQARPRRRTRPRQTPRTSTPSSSPASAARKEKSLNLKRKAKTHVEVITAEDVGKMPDKNVADSLQRVPGVTISSAGASEGGFDENDRVSMRGTNASLTQTLINGHPVSSGDWFVLNQVHNAGRSVSYTLLPSSWSARWWCTRPRRPACPKAA
jgi:outer membrane receptor for ferrienterochelin and colicin